MWPYGGYIDFRIRLFAEDGTVVEQEIYSHWDGGASVGIEGGLGMASTTTEDGQPVPMLFAQFDGEVTYSSPSPYSMDVGDDGLIDFTDPVVFWSKCARGPVPADAAAFAQAVIADPNFETTAPVAARVGGVEAVAIDVALSPTGRVCPAYRTDAQRWIHALEPGKRLRLFSSTSRRACRCGPWRSPSWRQWRASTTWSRTPHRSSTPSSSTRRNGDATDRTYSV